MQVLLQLSRGSPTLRFMSASLTSTPPTADEFVRVLELEAEGIARAAQRARTPDGSRTIAEALQLILETGRRGRKIVTSGIGKSAKIAEKIAATLSSTGTMSIFVHATEALHGELGVLMEGDTVLLLSQSGETPEVVTLATVAKQRRAAVISLSGQKGSRLAELSDIWFDTSVPAEACPHGLAPTTSTTLALAMGDALAVSLMKFRGDNIEDFAKNHPGGSLGRRLYQTVSTVMHPLRSVGKVSPEAPIDEVLGLSTETKLGGVLVVHANEPDKLLGIITDGDLRRALIHREKFFSLRAKDLMTQNPVTVASTRRLHEALALMENRPSQIAVLPVHDESHRCVGLVRIHDLVSTR